MMTAVNPIAQLVSLDGSSNVNFLQAGSGAQVRSVQSKLRDVVSVKDFGAVGDGVTDDTAAIAAAVAAARGKTLYFTNGQYKLNTDSGSITLEEITIFGETVQDGASTVIDQGAVFAIYGTTNSPFKVRRGVTFDGVGFYYPTQIDSVTPTVFPVTLAFDFTNGAVQFVWIKNCVSFNAYRFVDINDSGGSAGHIWIENNTICALNRGIYIRHNLEHTRIAGNNFTFGHWLPATEPGARAYVRGNCTYIQIDKSDGVEIVDNLFFGSLNGVLIAATGLAQMIILAVNKFDQTRYGIKATGVGNFDGIIIGNTFNSFNSQNTSLQSRSIEVSTSGAERETINITGNNFKLSTEEQVFFSGNTPTRDIIVSNCAFLSWAAYKAAGGPWGAINASGNNTNITVSGSRFMGGNNPTYSNGIVGALNTLEINGCRFESCFQVTNISTSFLTGMGNASFATGGSVSDVYTAIQAVWGPNNFDKPSDKTTMRSTILLFSNNASYADDAAAAAAGVTIGSFYRNGSVVQIRVT
jgi:hypothetical protein